MGRQIYLERIIKSSIKEGNDLEVLAQFSTIKGKDIGVRYPKKYAQEVIDTYLNKYNEILKSDKYSKFDYETRKNFSRQKALWLAYKKAYSEAGMDTSSWVYSPGQRTLDD